MAASGNLAMEPGYSSFLTRETNETRELPVEQNNDEIQAHSTSAFVSASEGHSSTIIPSGSTALNEVQQLKQQLEHLKMQMTTFISREPEKEPTKSGPEDVEMLQRVKECLRNHSDEWNSHDNLAEFSTESSLRTAVDALQRSIYYKSDASKRLVSGYTHDTHIYEQYYDSSDDEIANDEQYRNIRDRLIAKRREYVRSVELNMEVISEELIKFRLAKKLRKIEFEREKKEAEQKEAEKIAAEKRAAEEKAAASAADEEATSDEAFEVPIFAQPTINTVDWTSFRKLRKVDESLACAIDVLVGEPVIEVEAPRDQYGAWANNWNSDDLTEETAQVQKPNPIVSSKPQGQVPLPERVRIHSTPILTILAEFIDPEGTKPTLDGSPVIFLRPFKAFFHYEQRLRDWHKRLVEKFSPSSVSNEPASEEETSNASYHATESIAALNHLQCLLEFFDTYMVAKKEFLSGADCRKVHFSDLWCLYRPGMEVIGLDGRQAYRILQVNSAKHESISPYRSYYSYRGGNSQKAEFSMICSYIDFDGKFIGPVLRTFEIKRFDGERDITSFDVYPLRFHKLRRGEFSETEWNHLEKYPEQDRCRRNLIQRGAKFVEVAAIKHMYYSGSTMVVREEVESQVVVDFETAFATEGEMQVHIRPPTLETFIGEAVDKHMESSSSSGRCTCCIGDIVYDDAYIDKNQRNTYINDFLSIKNAQEEPSVAVFPRLFSEIRTNSASARYFTDDELAIMSYRVFGFVLRNRKWAQLDLTFLTEVQENSSSSPSTEDFVNGNNARWHQKPEQPKTAFDRLVLEKGHKDMIVSLITQHFRDRESKGAQMEQMDIVRGKGKGLILLLHGAPGVGKTTTAEGVAELFKKPLFQITCGDLGVTARDVEKALETNFNLATRWGCILLLDEADVFLAARDKEDFVRNGLVAAFLRVLEYYAGILFLTTNRIGDFDEAFTSRIHMSLYYPELDGEKTIEIFKLNLKLIQDRFDRMKRKIDIDEEGIRRFAEMHFWYYHASRWNGRQIRNACQTALALAEYQAQQSIGNTELDPKVRLTVQHFETVRDSYVEFTKYLGALYGANTSRRAKENFLRNEQDSDKEEEKFLTTEELYRKYKQRFNQRPNPVSQQRRFNRPTDGETHEPHLGQAQQARLTRTHNPSGWQLPDSSLSHNFEPQLQRAAHQQHIARPPSFEAQPTDQFQNTSQHSGGHRERLSAKQSEDTRNIDNGDSSSLGAVGTPVHPWSAQHEREYQHEQQLEQQQRPKRVPMREEEDDGASGSTNKEQNTLSTNTSRSGARFFSRSFRRHRD